MVGKNNHGKLNIQGEIEKALSEITGEEIELIASRKNRCRCTCYSTNS